MALACCTPRACAPQQRRAPAATRCAATPAAPARRHGAALLASLALLSAAPDAHAITTIGLANLRAETVACPAGQTTMTIGKPRCILVTAEATNPGKSDAVNADVFGRVYGVDGSNALDRDEASDAGRISNIKRVPAGVSDVTFTLIVSEDAAARGPLDFRRFKAVSYPGAAPLLEDSGCDVLSVEGCPEP